MTACLPGSPAGVVWPVRARTCRAYVRGYLHQGLRRHGFVAEAEHLARRTVRMVGISGLRECYHPNTGEGYAAQDFSWSSLILDLLAPVPDPVLG
jgi:hypothetical protein